MQNEIVINAERGETRVALLEKSQFTELHIERAAGKSVAGNVVKGKVTRVLPGMQAAFVDIGLDKAAFLYVGDYFDNTGENNGAPTKRRGRGNYRAIPKIETVLREGQEIVVQIAKEPIGSKGARIKSHVSIPGRHLVLTPLEKRVGVSRKIDNDRERKRLREIVDRLRPDDLGFIIRTAGENVREADIEADIRYLSKIWERIKTKNETESAPCVLHEEPDLALKVIRDFASHETKRVVVDGEAAYAEVKEFIEEFVADPKPELEHYTGSKPLFENEGLEEQIQANLERKVWLKSGGHLVIDQSEALTAIDVNTGRFTGKRDLEETVLKTNLEAVKEVVYQLRFRNIGGLIIIDLIDMESGANREKVYRALQDAIRSDKARTNILKISELGLVEMTRKRTRENLVQVLCEPCAYCEGRGYVLSRESVAYRIMREIRGDLPRMSGKRLALTVAPMVAEELFSHSQAQLRALGEEIGREIEVRARPGLHQEQFELSALEQGEPVELSLRWLRSREDIEREEREAAEAEKAEKERREAEKAERTAARAAERAKRDAEWAERRAKREAEKDGEEKEDGADDAVAVAAGAAVASLDDSADDSAEASPDGSPDRDDGDAEEGEGRSSRRGRRGGRRRGRGRGRGREDKDESEEGSAGEEVAASGDASNDSEGAEPARLAPLSMSAFDFPDDDWDDEPSSAARSARNASNGGEREEAQASEASRGGSRGGSESDSEGDDKRPDGAGSGPAGLAPGSSSTPAFASLATPAARAAARTEDGAGGEAIDAEAEKRILPAPEVREE